MVATSLNQQPGAVVLDHFRRGAGRRGHHRHAFGHGLQNGVAQSLAAGRMGHDVSGGQQVLGPGRLAQELHLVGHL